MNGHDKIDAAIESTDGQIAMLKIDGVLAPHGRPVVVFLPKDLSRDEAVAVFAFVHEAVTMVLAKGDAEAKPVSPIVLVRGLPRDLS